MKLKNIVVLSMVLAVSSNLALQGNKINDTINLCPKNCKIPDTREMMCTQALIPVPKKPGYWYTDGCKNKIIKLNGRGNRL